MNEVAEYVLDIKFIDNGAYVNALNHDFDTFSIDVFMKIRQKLSKVLNLDEILQGKMSLYKVNEMKREVDDMFLGNGMEQSAIRGWLLEELDYIDIIVGDAAIERIRSKARYLRCVEINDQILNVFNGNYYPKYVLDAICGIVRESYREMDLINIVTIIFNLRHFDQDSLEHNKVLIRNLLIVLSKMLEQNNERCNFEEIANIIFGLSRMNCSFVPVELFEVLLEKMKQCGSECKIKNVYQLMCGLRYLNGDVVPQDFFIELAKSIKNAPQMFSRYYLSQAFYCMQGFNSDVVPDQFFEVMEEKMNESDINLNATNLQKSLYGLIDFNGDAVSRIKQYLLKEVAELDYNDEMNEITIFCLVQVLSMMGEEWPDGLRERYNDLIDGGNMTTPLFNMERRALSFLNEVGFNGVKFNCYVDGFELDLYFPELNLNVEIDGKQHAFRSFKDGRRDDYLRRAHDMHIVRIKSDSVVEDVLMDVLFEEEHVSV